MKIIRKEPNEVGAYPPIQMGAGALYPGCALWPDGLETDTFQQYNGFVVLTIEPVEGMDTVTQYAPNVEAWEAWKGSLPEEPVPGPDEGEQEESVWREMAAAITEGVNQI